MHTIKYTRYPNNEIRATHYYRPSPKVVNENSDTAGEALSCPETAPSLIGEAAPALPSNLDISVDFSERGESNPHRRTVFGLKAKRTLLRLGGAFDAVDNTPSNYVFLTGTIPGGTHAAFMAMARESAYVTKALANWLRDTCPSKYWFYVWELQKRGALHIHYCIHAPNPAIRQRIISEWMDKWHSIIQKVGEKTACDMWIRADGNYHREGHSVLQAYAQEVHKSVAAYLSGYCGGAKDKHKDDGNSPYYPKRWWGCSRESTKLLRDLTEEVIVEHTNFRDTRYEMQVHYERVLHDSPKAHHYPHKVGIGSTVVSYHPEDKGQTIWRALSLMLYNPVHHPHTSFLIQTYRQLVAETILLLEASPKQLNPFSRPLLMTLRGLCFPSAVRGYGIGRRDITAIRMIDCTLNSPLCTLSEWEKYRLSWCHLQDSVKEAAQNLLFDKHGYVCNEGDILRLLDNHWSSSYLSTTEPRRDGAVSGGANGSISPQPPVPNQLELQCFSDS